MAAAQGSRSRASHPGDPPCNFTHSIIRNLIRRSAAARASAHSRSIVERRARLSASRGILQQTVAPALRWSGQPSRRAQAMPSGRMRSDRRTSCIRGFAGEHKDVAGGFERVTACGVGEDFNASQPQLSRDKPQRLPRDNPSNGQMASRISKGKGPKGEANRVLWPPSFVDVFKIVFGQRVAPQHVCFVSWQIKDAPISGVRSDLCGAPWFL